MRLKWTTLRSVDSLWPHYCALYPTRKRLFNMIFSFIRTELLWKATKCDAKEKKHNNGAVILITVINGISPVKVQCLDTCLIAGWHCPQIGGSSTCLRTPVLPSTDCDRNLFSDQQEAASQKHLVVQKPTRKWACCLLTLGPWWSLCWWVYGVNL